MQVKRVERHIITNNKNIDKLCFFSKNLYNHCNYILRQVYFKQFQNIIEFKSIIKTFTINDKIFYEIKENDLGKNFIQTNQVDYRALPSKTSQQIIKIVYENWNSFFKLVKIYNANKSKFKGVPKLPNYKDKIKGRNVVIFTNQQAKLKNGFVKFPKQVNIHPIKTKVNNICQVRIIPQTNCYVLEIIYKKEVVESDLNSNLYLGIDLGLNNLATCANNTGQSPFIVNGKIVKSINQYYNKKLAKLQSYLSFGTSKKIKKLTLKRNNKIQDYFHKTSSYIINYCLKFKIKTIIIGYNKDWKYKINFGKKTNQNFVMLPFSKLIQQLIYKGEEVNIKVIEIEESYTSKCSFLDLEELKKRENYLGKRIKRGQFRSQHGILINADVNSGYNMIRKVVPKIFNNQGIEGLELNPIIISL